jgi:succinate-semialdehyde dehydrogenase/glutarate-semialdehyde dehydrogenase
MAREDLLDGVHRQVEASVAAGARLLAGGHRVEAPGNFYAPTVLVDVVGGMPAYDEEIFGPVATVIIADGDDAVVTSDVRMPFGGTRASGYGGSWPRPASASSSTSGPGGSWTSRPSQRRRPSSPALRGET